MNEREALKLALEALTHLQPNALTSFYTIGNRDKAIKAIREALAQPEQEPVACVGTNGELMWLNKSKVIYSKPIPLYTTPPQRKPLTEKEIDQITEQLDETTIGWSTHEFARAIEAAHGIKE